MVSRTNRVPIMMSDDEINLVDDWRFKNRVATRSDAARRLIDLALRLSAAFEVLDDDPVAGENKNVSLEGQLDSPDTNESDPRIAALLERPTASIVEVGDIFFGLARNASYDAAKRGDIPTIQVGGRKMVVMKELCLKLGIKTRFTD